MRCELRRRDGGQGRRAGRRAIPTKSLFLEFSSHGSSPPAMDQSVARRTLQELIKREDLKNKSCVDCGNPNPQWASLRFAPFIPFTCHFPKSVPLSFAVFICLQCAGVHRGFGVHIRRAYLCHRVRLFLTSMLRA